MLSAASGESCLNKSASASETKVALSKSRATHRSYSSSSFDSRRYIQLNGHPVVAEYCIHLSESISTKSIMRFALPAPPTYCAIPDEKTNICFRDLFSRI